MEAGTSVERETFELAGNRPLFAQSWTPASTVRGVIGIVHGLGEHSSRYAPFAERFTRAGFRVVAYDQRGHGETKGRRGDAPGYEVMLDDVEALVAKLCADNASLPRFLFGQSLGGGLVLNLALRRSPKVDGIIASSPLLLLVDPPPAWKRLCARCLQRIWPTFQFRSGVEPRGLSHDPGAIAAYQRDPLIHDLVCARMAVQTIDAGGWALEHAADLSLPTLLLHGLADPITSAEATLDFALRAGHACTVCTFPDLFHELYWEIRRDEVFEVTLNWLNQRIAVLGN